LEGEGERKDTEKHFERKETREKSMCDVKKEGKIKMETKKRKIHIFPNTSSEYIHKVKQQ
jgi:hypothetical protein